MIENPISSSPQAHPGSLGEALGQGEGLVTAGLISNCMRRISKRQVAAAGQGQDFGKGMPGHPPYPSTCGAFFA